MACQDAQTVRVLFIEAGKADLDRVCASLNRDAFSLVGLPWNEDTCRQCAAGDFDVLILDTGRTDSCDGLDLLDQIRRRIDDVPIVVLCSEISSASALEALARGAQDCLAKTPGALEVLPVVLTQAVTRQRLAVRLEASEYRLSLLAEQLPAVVDHGRAIPFDVLAGQEAAVLLAFTE